MSQNSGSPTVLIVEDEREVANVYSEYLEAEYDVRTAHTGAHALEQLDIAPDVVLLDRRLPDMSGADVLRTIQERKIDTRVAMVTAVEPDFDIIEMGIDEYLIKPVEMSDLADVVERVLTTDDIHEKRRELSAKQVKRNVLAVEKSPSELEKTPEFARLEARIEQLEREIAALESDEGSQGLADPSVA